MGDEDKDLLGDEETSIPLIPEVDEDGVPEEDDVDEEDGVAKAGDDEDEDDEVM